MQARIDFPFADGRRLQAQFAAPLKVLRAEALAQVAPLLAEAEQAALAGHWVVGFVSYEAAPAFDPALVVRTGSPLPLACFAIYAQAAPLAPKVALPDFFCEHWQSSLSAADAAADIARIRRGIADGDYYQINLTMRASSPFSGSPAGFFDALADSQPGAFAASLDWSDGQILSVSPELFFERRGRTLSTRPMKGTAPRHADAAADCAAAEYLRSSDKERAENLMIVDLLRNDLARVAETGSVRVEQLFAVEPWPSVWQMTSTISAELRPAVGLAEIFAALFPCGSVTGAPKVAAMAEIARLETAPRGIYCGAIGLIKPGGDAVFSVAIRTVSITSDPGPAGGQGAGAGAGIAAALAGPALAGAPGLAPEPAAGGRGEPLAAPSIAPRTATCGLGSAITIDSTAADEYAEWIAKRRFLLRASAPFELLETLRLEDGVFHRLDAHLQRMLGSAAWFGFSADEAALRAALATLAQPAAGAWRVRLLLRRDGAVRCEAFPLDAAPAEVRVRLADRPIVSAPEFLHHKTTERRAYEAFADLPAGVFDTLLYNAQGELTEFTRGNVFLEVGGVLLTPPLSAGLLPGILRAELLQSGRAREAELRREQLADGRLWFGNSLRGLIPACLNGAPPVK